MARTLWLYNIYRALCTSHVHAPFFVFVFLARGLSLSQITLLLAIFSGTVIALEVPTGAWADRLGRRRSMGLGALVMSLASVGYFFAPGFATIAICEFLFAAGLTLTSGADSAYLYDQLKAAGRADEYLKREATASAAKYVGLGIAAAGGGVLAFLVSLRSTFLVTAAASFVAFVVTFFFPEAAPRTREDRQLAPGPSLRDRIGLGLRTIRQNPAIWWAILYSSLIFVLIRVSNTLFQPVVKNQGFNNLGLGLVFAGLNFVASAAALRVGRVNWKRWQGSILWALPVLLAVCYLFVGLLGPLLAVGLLIGHFVVTGVYSPVVKTLINQEMADSQVRATVLSAESAVKRLAVLVVTPVLSLILILTEPSAASGSPSTLSMRPALFVCGGIAVLGTLARFLYRRQKRASVRGSQRGTATSAEEAGVVPVGLE